MNTAQLKKLVIKTLEDNKAVNIQAIDVRKQTTLTDYMIVCSGTSNRHLKALSNHLITECKKRGVVPYGMEGERECEWILVDLVDVVVHLMLPATRDFYQLEKLWMTD